MKAESETNSFDEKRASNYDGKIRRLMPAYESLHQMTNALLQTLLPGEAHLLVVGAGTGMDIITCGQANPTWSFTAVEPSAEMFGLCRRNITEAGLGGRVILHCGYLETLPAEPVYDAATSILVSHFIEREADKLKYFSEISYRLRPGSPVVLADLHALAERPAFNLQTEAWKRFYAAAAGDLSEVEKSFRYIERDISFITENRLSAILHESGFSEFQAFFKAFSLGGWVAFR